MLPFFRPLIIFSGEDGVRILNLGRPLAFDKIAECTRVKRKGWVL